MGFTTTKELRWDAPGAPALTGQVGSFYNLIKTFLVSCGWSIEWDEPANYKIVLRNSMAHGGSGCYVRVLDDGSFTGGARVARMDVYEAMTDIDSGTATAGGGYVWKAQTADSAPRAYTLHGDERTFYATTYVGGISPPVVATSVSASYLSWVGGAGDAEPSIPGDSGVFCAASTVENPGTGGYVHVDSSIVRIANLFQGYSGWAFHMSRDTSLSAVVTPAAIPGTSNSLTLSNDAHGGLDYGISNPSPGTTGVHMLPAMVGAVGTIRGRMRGLYIPLNRWTGGGSHVGSVHMPLNTQMALSLAAMAGNGAASGSQRAVGRLFVERILSWDDV